MVKNYETLMAVREEFMKFLLAEKHVNVHEAAMAWLAERGWSDQDITEVIAAHRAEKKR